VVDNQCIKVKTDRMDRMDRMDRTDGSGKTR
jgi:hypothetical protein